MYRQRYVGHKRHAQEEIVSEGGWYLLVVFVLLVGFTCGWALPSCAEESERQIIASQALALVAQAAGGGVPMVQTLLAALLNAVRMVGLLCLASLSPYLTVCSGLALWAKGFGIGFTLHGLQLAHGFGGLFLAFVMLSLQNCLYLPAYAYMAVHRQAPGAASRASLWEKCMAYLWRHKRSLATIFIGIMVECVISPLILKTVYGWIF